MRVRRLKKTPAHLEITAFINLIVVLVPFLLSTAVFTRLAVIDLALPAQSSDAIAQHDDATVLAEPNTSYEKLVKVMDAVRGGHQAQNGKAVHVDYFPNISIGDAPIVHTVAASTGP